MGYTLSISVSENTYIRNPLETDLGKKIIKHSIDILSEKGFHCFNFKTLACQMKSTEASVYRYFENKQMLLVYLTSWYWEFLHFHIQMNMKNIDEPERKLKILIKTIVHGLGETDVNDYVDIKKLHKIIVENSSRVTHMKKVLDCGKDGLFTNYMNLNSSISNILMECDPGFKYPTVMASNVIRMAIDHSYYAEHLCGLTDITNCTVTKKEQLEDMLYYFLERVLQLR